jgi:hypothetical protein
VRKLAVIATVALLAALGAANASAHPLDGGIVDCAGDGVSGKRIQAVYGHTAAVDNSATVIPLITSTMAPRVDRAYDLSAQLDVTGATRAHPRWVCSGGQLDVLNLQVSNAASHDLGALLSEMAGLRGNVNRKYLVWMDADEFNSIATTPSDERADPAVNDANGNNGRPADVALVANHGWDDDVDPSDGISVAYSPQHELAHMLGAVHAGAPHGLQGHCFQGDDAMCFDPGGGKFLRDCVSDFGAHPYFALLDCKNDDYFASNPPRCSYLATHWNIYNSGFLDVTGGQVPEGCGAKKCKKAGKKKSKKREASTAKKKHKKKCKKHKRHKHGSK